MIRRCDGTDPNLRMHVDSDGNKVKRRSDTSTEKPCDCGKVFDDVNHMVFWPHERF